jgi:hypothetical protein
MRGRVRRVLIRTPRKCEFCRNGPRTRVRSIASSIIPESGIRCNHTRCCNRQADRAVGSHLLRGSDRRSRRRRFNRRNHLCWLPNLRRLLHRRNHWRWLHRGHYQHCRIPRSGPCSRAFHRQIVLSVFCRYPIAGLRSLCRRCRHKLALRRALLCRRNRRFVLCRRLHVRGSQRCQAIGHCPVRPCERRFRGISQKAPRVNSIRDLWRGCAFFFCQRSRVAALLTHRQLPLRPKILTACEELA